MIAILLYYYYCYLTKGDNSPVYSAVPAPVVCPWQSGRSVSSVGQYAALADAPHAHVWRVRLSVPGSWSPTVGTCAWPENQEQWSIDVLVYFYIYIRYIEDMTMVLVT